MLTNFRVRGLVRSNQICCAPCNLKSFYGAVPAACKFGSLLKKLG